MKGSIDLSNADEERINAILSVDEDIADIFKNAIDEEATLSSVITETMSEFVDPMVYFQGKKEGAASFALSRSSSVNSMRISAEYEFKEKAYRAQLERFEKLEVKNIARNHIEHFFLILETGFDILSDTSPSAGNKSHKSEVIKRVQSNFVNLLGIFYSSAFDRSFLQTKFMPPSKPSLASDESAYPQKGAQELRKPQAAQMPGLDPMSTEYPVKMGDLGEGQAESSELESLSKKIEREILGGEINVMEDGINGDSYYFKPIGVNETLPVSRASSMVLKLASVVVCMRRIVKIGDTLIIEEPESHLHPRVQAKFADCIALLVKSGVRVIMITHSEWIAERLAYLVRLSDLSESQKEKFPDHQYALKESDVGVWEFKRDDEKFGSTVHRVDFMDGGYDLDFSDFGIETFNSYSKLETAIENDDVEVEHV